MALIGKRILVHFEFPQVYGKAMYATIEAEATATPSTDNQDAFLVRLDSPFQIEGTPCEYFVALARQYGDGTQSVFDVSTGEQVWCYFVRISPEQATSNQPCDVSLWRGGLACLGGINLIGPLDGDAIRRYLGSDS
jgi:hypothetical protein